jgi:4-amino-4-deoxy-L-arabinose transferase-like glycosyltransferase
MAPAARAGDRPIPPGTYGILFGLFAAVLFTGHFSFVGLPYFWDEAGQFIPAALDILNDGSFIPHSTTPNIHPPAVMLYLAAVWKVFGFSPAATRCAMLLLAVGGALAGFLLAIELSREARGMPALMAVGLLCASPVFFTQGLLAQLDAPAMLFTALALLFFLQDRQGASVAVCVVLVLVKETSMVVPLVFAGWLIHERRWREAAWYAFPGVVLGAWVAYLWHGTGSWSGSPAFAQYNLYYPLHPVRILVTFLRRLYFVGFANLHWIGATAVLYTWRRTTLFRSRSWRVAGLLLAVHLVLFTVLGGAVLERYLLPVLPIVYAAMAAAFAFVPRVPRMLGSAALVAGLAAGNFVNPPYPFPYENNLAFRDFLELHQQAAAHLAVWHPNTVIHTAWPLSAELSKPELGFVKRALPVHILRSMSNEDLGLLNWASVDVLVVYSRTWNPKRSFFQNPAVLDFWKRIYDYVPNVTREEARQQVPFPLEAHFERRGQWVDIYANPEARETPAVRAGAPKTPANPKYSTARIIFSSRSSEPR